MKRPGPASTSRIVLTMACGLGLCGPGMAADSHTDMEIAADHPAALWQQAERRLQAWSTTPERPVSVEFAGAWPTAPFVPGRYRMSWRIKPLDAHTREASISLSPVAVEPSAQSGRAQEMRALVHDLRQAWVAQTPLRQKQRLSCERDLRQVTQVARAGQVPRWMGDCASLAGKELLRPLSTGDVLLAADLREPVAVHRMDEVSATTRVGMVDIEVRAVALNDAALGQTLKIKPLGSDRVLDATATGPNAVNVK